jgi:hypothetical protein
MKAQSRFVTLIATGLLAATSFYAVPGSAQQVQVPTLQVCNATKIRASALVHIDSRIPPSSAGNFTLRGELVCNPKSGGIPSGSLGIFGVNMNDSIVQGNIQFTTFEQVTSTGTATPTAWANGRCKANVASPAGVALTVPCHYWLMVADNRNPNNPNGFGHTPDIVSFLVFDASGTRIAYGTGPVLEGDVQVAPTSN